MTFEFDTSGHVIVQGSQRDLSGLVEMAAVNWESLSPFVQGYVEAMFKSTQKPFPWMRNRRVAELSAGPMIEFMEAPRDMLAGEWLVVDRDNSGAAISYGCETSTMEITQERGWVIVSDRGCFMRTGGYWDGDRRCVMHFKAPWRAAKHIEDVGGYSRPPVKRLAFSDLAPETLAWITEDCLNASTERHVFGHAIKAKDGAAFWRNCQGGYAQGFRPLTPYLGGDGKIYFKEN